MTPALARVAALFVCSGATSLVYQSVWARQLHLVFGTSAVAISTVLTAFMAGLGLGGWLGARWADGYGRPLRAYAMLEAGIAAFAVAFPVLLTGLAGITAGAGVGVEAVAVGALLVMPTTAMGATLPFLARFAVDDEATSGRRLSLLYGLNTAGAVLGAFAGGFLLLPMAGLRQTTALAVALNVALALLAWREDRTVTPASRRPTSAPAAWTGAVVGAMALGGFASMVDEVAWTRVLVLVLGPSAYAFSVMLVTYLVGIATGGSIGGRLADMAMSRGGIRAVALLFAATELLAGASSLLALRVARELPFWYVWLFDALQAWTDPIWLFVVTLLVSGAVLAPPAVFLGAAFPVAARLVVTDDAVGGPVGRVYAAACGGGAVGALVAGLWLLPGMGARDALVLAATVNGVAAAWVVGRLVGVRPVAGLALVMGVILWAAPSWDRRRMTAGTYHYLTRFSDHSRDGIEASVVGDYEMLLYDEGVSSVVTVGRNPRTGNLWLANNGKIDASSQGDLPTQILVAALPLAEASGGDVLVIGLASGITAGAVTVDRAVRSIDIVEIEPGIEAAARLFGAHNHAVLDDPRVRLHADDGRHFVAAAPVARWDVVISEPSNPWISGVANLFTKDFLELGRERLKPGGVWAQWLQVYGMSSEDLRCLLGTFADVYPHVALYASNDLADVILLGSDRPLVPRLEDAAAVFEDPARAAEWRRAGIDDAYELVGLYLLDRDGLLAATHGVPRNTDDNMLIEFSAPLRLHADLVERNLTLLANVMDIPDLDASQADWRALAERLGAWGHNRRAAKALRRAAAFETAHSEAWWALESAARRLEGR